MVRLLLLSLAAFVFPISAAPLGTLEKCSSYTLIDTRGTGEPQGPSIAFRTMNTAILTQKAGGKVYNTVYPAALDQDSASGTQDIINHIRTTLASNPSECFILEGYSQGAAAVVNALPNLDDNNAFNAIKGVFLVGNPEHKAGLACNVDTEGGTSTRDVSGFEEPFTAGIPSNWVSKTLDVCNFGDGVCDTTHGIALGLPQHIAYGFHANVQNMGTQFALQHLNQ